MREIYTILTTLLKSCHVDGIKVVHFGNGTYETVKENHFYLSLIVARVKFEPESSASHESSSSQFFFSHFFPIISFDYTVNVIVKKMSDS